MSERKYSEEHEWVVVEGDVATIGISNHAQEQLGDVVYVELPEIGSTLSKGGEAGTVESVKAANEVYSPVSGEVVEVNGDVEGDPSLVNAEATGKGWFFKIKIADASAVEGLLDENAYKALIE